MNKEHLIKYFGVNTDAYPTNRGLLYQYLVVLKKWVQNYIDGNDDKIYVEVDDDIKQVGDKLIFTQVKSYTSSFNLNSPEIKKSLYNFFILFVQNESDSSQEFHFVTNSCVAPHDKDLKSWVENEGLFSSELRRKIILRLRDVLKTEISRRKNSHLSKSNGEKNDLELSANHLTSIVDSSLIEDFIDNIKWRFGNEDPNEAVLKTKYQIKTLLKNPKFKSKSDVILESVLLSEIYYCSQYPQKDQRVLTISKFDSLLEKADDELKHLTNPEFLELFDLRLGNLECKFIELKQEVTDIQSRVEELEDNVTSNSFKKELTLIPQIYKDEILGREQALIDFVTQHQLNHTILVRGEYGSGKSFFVKHFLKRFYNDYDHLISIESGESFVESLIQNVVLLSNLQLKFHGELSTIEKIELISNRLSEVPGNNLIIIFNFYGQEVDLRPILSLQNWKIIVTSRQNINAASLFLLPRLDVDSLKCIYQASQSLPVNEQESVLDEFIEYVEYNTLVIELSSKTISNSIDLNLNKLFDYIKEQRLDDFELGIDVFSDQEGKSIQLYSFLQQNLEIKNLTGEERFILEFIALLPSDDILIMDLVEICGKDYVAKNKINFANHTNSLYHKGWIEKEKGFIRMHKIVKEFIVYSTRSNLNGFNSCIFLLVWLHHRIDENAQTNPEISFKFLRYGESVLKTIKEPYRTSIYQPLLLLENAVLNTLRWQGSPKLLHDRWLNLKERAENYLDPKDPNLGVIYNNVGLSYMYMTAFDEAKNYLEKSTSILQDQLDKSHKIILITYNNLLQVYMHEGNLEQVNRCFEKSMEIRQKYSLYKDQSLPQTIYNMALIFHDFGDYKKALGIVNMAINMHEALPIEMRFDYYLVDYLIFLSDIFLKLEYDCQKLYIHF